MSSTIKPRPLRPPTILFFAGIMLGLAGCAAYHPRPLPQTIDLAADVYRLEKPGGQTITMAPDGLSPAEAAVLAVRNNPDLKAQRKQLGVKHAQLFATRLLPDPQLSASLDHPTSVGADLVDAFGLGLNYDITALINRGARVDGARQEEAQARLDVLWQEWQVSQRARMLVVNLAAEQQQIDLLLEMRDLYRQRYQSSQAAVARGDVTLAEAGTDLTALLDTLSQINQLEQTRNGTRHELNLLIGLAADASLKVRLPAPHEAPDGHLFKTEIQSLSRRRPDLLALQAGYLSQEAKVHAAVLAQFPSLSIGITRARDTGSIYTTGFAIGVNLPFFSGNRGAIAIERATREQLAAEYQARLDQTAVDADRLIRLLGIVADQQQQLDEYLPALKALVDRGRVAYRHGDIDVLTFLNMESTWVARRLEQIDLDQTQRITLIALQTVLAIPDDSASQTAAVPEAVKGDQP